MRIVFALILLLASGATFSSNHIYPVLESQNLLDYYLADRVGEIAAEVVFVSNRRRPVQVNARQRAGALNIYIIDAARVSGEPLDNIGISLQAVHRNFIANKATESIFIDANFLRELVTLNIAFWAQGVDMAPALADFEVRGMATFRNLWDPALNPGLSSGSGQAWHKSTSGVIAFLLAHELGHIDLDFDPPGEQTRPFRPRTIRERDIYWACPELVHSRAAYWRNAEMAADQYAIGILSRLSVSRYGPGANWYQVYLLNLGMIKAIPIASPAIVPFLRQRYGNLLEPLRSGSVATPGPVEVFYPKTHPDVLSRLSYLIGQLYGESPDPMIAMWNQRLQRECQNIQ